MSSAAPACWCRTWPDCIAGPPASPGHSRAPSSAPWPSAPFGCAWSGPSRLRGTPCAAQTNKQTNKQEFHVKSTSQRWNLQARVRGGSSHFDGLVAVGAVVDDGEGLLETGSPDADDVGDQLADSDDHLDVKTGTKTKHTLLILSDLACQLFLASESPAFWPHMHPTHLTKQFSGVCFYSKTAVS